MNLTGKKTLIGPPKACRAQRTSFPANRRAVEDAELIYKHTQLFDVLRKKGIAIGINYEAIWVLTENN